MILEPRSQDPAFTMTLQEKTHSPWPMDPDTAVDTRSSHTSSFHLSQSEATTQDLTNLYNMPAVSHGPSSNRERLGVNLNGDNAGRLPPASESETQNSEARGLAGSFHPAQVVNETCNTTPIILKEPSANGLDYGGNTEQRRFPPKPTMKVLIPFTSKGSSDVGMPTESRQMFRSSVQHHVPTAEPERHVRSSRAMAFDTRQAPRTPVSMEALPRRPGQSESSGQFFNRMTGRASGATIPTLRPTSPIQSELRENESGRLKPQGQSTENATGSTAHNQQAIGVLTEMDYAVDHSDAATASKIQVCVEQLRALGFCSHDNNGVGRLIVYAQAADGDLSDAIDMIDEEQQVYRQRL